MQRDEINCWRVDVQVRSKHVVEDLRDSGKGASELSEFRHLCACVIKGETSAHDERLYHEVCGVGCCLRTTGPPSTRCFFAGLGGPLAPPRAACARGTSSSRSLRMVPRCCPFCTGCGVALLLPVPLPGPGGRGGGLCACCDGPRCGCCCCCCGGGFSGRGGAADAEACCRGGCCCATRCAAAADPGRLGAGRGALLLDGPACCCSC